METAEVCDVLRLSDVSLGKDSWLTYGIYLKVAVAGHKVVTAILEGHFVGHRPPVVLVAVLVVLRAVGVKSVGKFVADNHEHRVLIGRRDVFRKCGRKHQRRIDENGITRRIVHCVHKGKVRGNKFIGGRYRTCKHKTEHIIAAQKPALHFRNSAVSAVNGLCQRFAIRILCHAVLIPLVRVCHVKGAVIQFVNCVTLCGLAHPVNILDAFPEGLLDFPGNAKVLVLEFLGEDSIGKVI